MDGTYELFRQYFGQPPRKAADGEEIGAVRGVLLSLLGMVADGASHVGVATDHVVESFRNDLWPGYKTGAGIEPELRVAVRHPGDGPGGNGPGGVAHGRARGRRRPGLGSLGGR